MDGKIQEFNGRLIAVSPTGQCAVVNTAGKIVSMHVRKEEVVRVAQSQKVQGAVEPVT